MSKRNKDLISTDTAKKLQFLFMTMDKYTVESIWKAFTVDEKSVARNVVPLVDTHAKSILSSMMRSMNEPDMDTGEDIDFSEGDETHTEPPFDHFINEALSVASVYDRISITFKVMFLYGMYTGRALTDSQFSKNFSIDNVLGEEIVKPSVHNEMQNTFNDIMALFSKLSDSKAKPKEKDTDNLKDFLDSKDFFPKRKDPDIDD